ncbi:MAG: MBL fold metallo-hydrolase [Gemmatimonadaceae bacterium]|nr:MBL fold metallo-hydrolase [Gemmatimonadaceae bacterium]
MSDQRAGMRVDGPGHAAHDRRSRRAFLGTAGSCAAHLALAATFAPSLVRAAWTAPTRGTVVAVEPWGRLEQVADGVWALISAPLSGDRTTLANGGIIAGRNGVMAIEGLFTSHGARWMASQARQLTGRWPTHVVVTHYHADHANGVDGYIADGFPTRVLTTAVTRDQVLAKNTPLVDSRTAALRDAVLLSAASETVVDLGGRRVRIVPRAGHTSSDVSIELDDPSLIFMGDLMWNGMIPNYVDAMPVELARQVRAVQRARSTIYVPGHGVVADNAAVERYLSVLGEIETAARAAHARGTTAAEAAKGFRLPAALGEWALFGPTFYERAFAAWNRELGAPR